MPFDVPRLSSSPPATTLRASRRTVPPFTPSSHDSVEHRLLLALFNSPMPTRTQVRRDPPPGAMIAALHSRIVKAGDASALDADLDTLLQALREGVALASVASADQPTHCAIGKALHLIREQWRMREEAGMDTTGLVKALELCATLIRQIGWVKLETCGVIMFHLGELLTHAKLSALCEVLIRRTLVPKFRAGVELIRDDPVAAGDVMFGLSSTLRASEYWLTTPAGAGAARTAADALVPAVHRLLDRLPDMLRHCETAKLGLVARHGSLYLRQLAAVQSVAEDDAAPERQVSVARLLKAWMDEVNRRNAQSASEPTDLLRYAPHYYTEWLGQQSCDDQRQLRLRSFDAPTPAAAPTVDRWPLIACADRLMSRVQSGGIRLDMGARARMLLEMDSLYQQLHLDRPLNAAHDTALDDIRAFMERQAAQLLDPTGKPLLGPALPLLAGLHSWQRLLLTQLVR